VHTHHKGQPRVIEVETSQDRPGYQRSSYQYASQEHSGLHRQPDGSSRKKIYCIEDQVFREVSSLRNVFSNKAFINVASSIRNALDIVEPLTVAADLIKPQAGIQKCHHRPYRWLLSKSQK
jgi:hypothetical protein